MITKSIVNLRDFAQARNFRKFRKFNDMDLRYIFKKCNYSFAKRNAFLLKAICESEDPIVFPDEKITFTRTNINIPQIFNDRDIKKAYKPKKGTYYNVQNNICIDYAILLNEGLEKRLILAQELLNSTKDKKERDFLESVIISINAVLNLASRYATQAEVVNNQAVADVMRKIPRYAASNFYEALQSIRFVSSMFNLAGNYQFGFGRMDQYLYPFYEQDIKENKLTKDEAKNILAEFFVSLNKDTDLYFGIQQGDNGQSVMLGGVKADGTTAINNLTYLIMEVSRDLRLIDPKINLRIDSNTPDDLIELGCELTKVGLGFPQYSNDDVVIPALVKKGYTLEDAREYTVAACWEFIIPGKGIEIVNQGSLSFPAAVDNAFKETMKVPFLFSFDKFRKNIEKDIFKQIKNILKNRNLKSLPAPLASVFFHDVLEKKSDATVCAKYQNIGIHGAGSANGADALVSIKMIFETEGIDGLKELKEAIQKNFVGYESLRNKLINEMPKVGNDDERVDSELKFLFDKYADCCEALSSKDKKIRPGSGSAMYYLWLTQKANDWIIEPIVGATAEGRLQGEALSTSLAPSHGIKVNGILSTFKSFSNIDYSRIMNGGPVTVELTPSLFEAEDGIQKLRSLIKYFVKLGNQQLQLNVLDLATLEDALIHPEKYRNLIVRVWGWSGYFCELAPEYQQHIINRHRFGL